MAGFRVTARTGAKVEKLSAATLAEALEIAEREARVASAGPRRRSVDMRMRSFTPEQQVKARIELAGPGTRGGLDVRGDGSIEAWVGGWRRRVLEPEGRETPYAALRRALASGSASVEP